MDLPDEFPPLEDGDLYGVKFTPNTDVDNLQLYYDHQDRDRDWITLHPSRVDEKTVYFISGEAPDPLELHLDTGELYDMDTNVLIGTDAEVIVAYEQ